MEISIVTSLAETTGELVVLNVGFPHSRIRCRHRCARRQQSRGQPRRPYLFWRFCQHLVTEACTCCCSRRTACLVLRQGSTSSRGYLCYRRSERSCCTDHPACCCSRRLYLIRNQMQYSLIHVCYTLRNSNMFKRNKRPDSVYSDFGAL